MRDQTQLQCDLSPLGIAGLGAFRTVLATLSSDNIAPTALVEIEQLGANFKVSGRFAAKVPDLLGRFNIQTIGRLAVTVGWRKGDSASYLAETAGGQSAALLSVSLANLFRNPEYGLIVSQLSSRLLSRDFCAASVLQLAHIVTILAEKLSPLAFGNFLPEQIIRVHSAYSNLGITAPSDLLEPLTVDAAVDLLESIHQALCDEALIVRISGSFAMGHILGLTTFMFPQDMIVTVESLVIHKGERQSIYIEIRNEPSTPVAIKTENIIDGSRPFNSTISISDRRYRQNRPDYQFTWSGLLAQRLHLTFLELGSICTQEILTAFCNLLVATATVKFPSYQLEHENSFPQDCLAALLEPHPYLKMEKTCQDILLSCPTSGFLDLHTAFFEFRQNIEAIIDPTKICSCSDTKCTFVDGWPEVRRNAKKAKCQAYRMWLTIGDSLGSGLLCFLINAKGNATVPVGVQSCHTSIARSLIQQGLCGESDFCSTQRLYKMIMNGRGLANSQGSTIYPTVLGTIQIPPGSTASFELVDGRLIFQDRYYSEMDGASARPRTTTKKSILKTQDGIIPSSIGEHTNLLMTARESMGGRLEVRAGIDYGGLNVHLELSEIIKASFALERTLACSHPSTNPLAAGSHPFMLTSVSAPRSSKASFIAVVMTQFNPTAQLLCCEPGARSILMQNCCFDCALAQASDGGFNIVIVS